MIRYPIATPGILAQCSVHSLAVTLRAASLTPSILHGQAALCAGPCSSRNISGKLCSALLNADLTVKLGSGSGSCVTCQRRSFFSFPENLEGKESTTSDEKLGAAGQPAAKSSKTAPANLRSSPSTSAGHGAEPTDANSGEVRTTTSHVAFQTELETKLTELRQQYLDPCDKVYRFLNPLKSTMPMVMMLGNHSSGKSTFINYLAGREIQETGVAPTDDCFTVIKRDTFDMDADGPSLVSNPKYQFEPLQQFGIPFVTHFKMKTRKMGGTSLLPMNMMLIDTPGMIDTPLHSNRADTAAATGVSADYLNRTDHTRGYDFLGVTRWFAQQSDVILLMFDPANPGTTGETLDVLTKSLAGYEHKFLLVLNKVDVFEKVIDFGRAYGTLCWNLSKVMKMKDIPRVYTTCTPLGTSAKTKATESAAKASGTLPDSELSRQRHEIITEVMAAPMRRVDNLITETEDSARNLLLAVRAAKVLRRDYLHRELTVFSALSFICLLCPAAAAVYSVNFKGTLLLTLLSVAVGCGGVLAARAYMREFERNLLNSADYVISRLFLSKTRTLDVELRWQRSVRPEIIRVTTEYQSRGVSGIMALPTCSERACRRMESVVRDDIPLLRRSVTEYKETYFRKECQTAKSTEV